VPIAIPAGVAVWSGWVGLGALCGFGPVNLLPGIGGGFTINTAVTLPIGVEAYAAFALGAWISAAPAKRARRFAGWSAAGALAYGMLGQVTYHLLASHGYAQAPWPVVVIVSCMPVAVLGFAAALAHLLHGGERGRDSSASDSALPGAVPATRPASLAAFIPPYQEMQERQRCSPATAKKMRKEMLRMVRSIEDSLAVTRPAGESGRGVATFPPSAPPALNGSAHG
jgi:hypothetical protein